jgi:hypothetical protein
MTNSTAKQSCASYSQTCVSRLLTVYSCTGPGTPALHEAISSVPSTLAKNISSSRMMDRQVVMPVHELLHLSVIHC